ncbi:unnamed protein product [Sphagnum troendelagicum]|uniref:MICOS complex subunit MIC60 n=1 Tax=Sphagnum troendelagicum TaxID=128251 RepID=A0ABP0V4X2_9BRYO
MSAVSSLLRRRTSWALTSLLKSQYHQRCSFVSSHCATSNARRGFPTTDAQRFSQASLFPAQESLGRFQQFATAASVPPPPSLGPDLSGSSSGKLRKRLGVVAAATIAAVAAAIYFTDGAVFQDFANGKLPDGLLFGNKQTKPDHQSKLDKTTSNSQPIKRPESNPGFVEETESGSNVTQVADSKLGKGDEIADTHQGIQQMDANPQDLREANVILQAIQGTPLKPQVMEDEKLKPEQALEDTFEIRELEDVDNKPQATQEHFDVRVIDETASKPEESQDSSPDIQGVEESEKTSEVIEEILRTSEPEKTPEVVEETQAMPVPPLLIIEKTIKEETSGSEAFVTEIFEVLEVDRPVASHESEEMMPETTSVVENGLTDVESSSQRAADELKVSSEGSTTEDQEINNFLTEMEETASADDLKDFSDKVLLNQVTSEEDEKEIASMKDESSPSDQSQLVEILDSVEQVLKVGFEATTLEAPQKLKGLAKSYLLIKDQDDEVERFKGEDSGNKDEQEPSAGEENTVRAPVNNIDLVVAIHAAEARQAEIDAQQYGAFLLKVKEEHQQELNEALEQQEKHAEYASRLEKALDTHKERAEAQLRQQMQWAEERLCSELKKKEEHAISELEKMELLTQARTTAAVTLEKAKHLEDTKDLQIQVEALHKAFYARSEEAKVSHTTNKLALGALALEDAIIQGAPVGKEVELLMQAAGGFGIDEVVDMAVMSLPEDAFKEGTWTHNQLQEKFVHLQRPMRELGLIPAGQGGVLTHLLARAVAAIKVREVTGGYGIEAVITKVEKCLENGKLLEAAATLEKGLEGTKGEEIVAEWVRQARNRVVAEQALTMVQAHAIAVASALV